MSNQITEGKDRELPPDGDGVITRAPTPATLDLRAEISEASAHKEAGQGDAMRARSSIESRADLRIAATNEAMRAEPTRSAATLVIEADTARRWADLDAADFGRIRSEVRRDGALDAIAGHMRASPEYADELKKRSPVIADAAKAINEERARVEREASERAAAEQRQAAADQRNAAADKTRETLIDAAGLAAVAAIRARQSAQVVEQLAKSPDTATQQLREAQQALKAPPLDGRVTAPDDPDIAAQRARVLKRPVIETELSEALLTRFVVSHEKRGLLDKGATEFTFKAGQQQGQVAFRDAGKSLSTELEDKAIIRAMVEVAVAKNWREATVSGTDDFRRNAWLELSMNGLKVKGYEPRQADLQILADLQKTAPKQDARQPDSNTITVIEREQQRAATPQPEAPAQVARKHIDADAMSAHHKTVIDNSRTLLKSQDLGDKFTEAALRELEAKLRGERVYVGELVAHGKAPYQFDNKKDDSYYVTLKTPAGEQVIWGKGLVEAMQGRKPGDEIVLQNVGRRDVTVQAHTRDDKGAVVATHAKDSHLNAWTSELLSEVTARARADFANRANDRQPSLGVLDPKAERTTAQSPAADREPKPQQRSQEAQRNSRDR
ncbi:hypothetical protein EIP75_21620 [Aquabacterium soli]|uniref:Large polyvalent protein-associated domain-containing protein n=1 Tax=Aquabacterium soli TaxID=2493092 RepID=A0A3R8S4J0_9BURK|nr:LPD7 domain-containing protein [Aquabacterium soli]RRS01177.1 hypothetical protein EIP75_21620 [Aquabacterium soli]